MPLRLTPKGSAASAREFQPVLEGMSHIRFYRHETTQRSVTKSKTRAVRLKIAKQVGHRGARYQNFKGRRGVAMDEERQEIIRERRRKSIRFMEGWLEAQLQANAEEGTLRHTLKLPAPLLVQEADGSPRSPGSIPGATEGEIETEDLGTSSHPLITSFFQARRGDGL